MDEVEVGSKESTATVSAVRLNSVSVSQVSSKAESQLVETPSLDKKIRSPLDAPSVVLGVDPFESVLPEKEGKLERITREIVTAVNLSCSSVAKGKKVLFLIEDSTRREEFKRTLKDLGFGELVLDLGSSPEKMRSELGETLGLGVPLEPSFENPQKVYSSLESRLNNFVYALRRPIRSTECSGYDAMSYVIGNPESHGKRIDFSTVTLREWDKDKYERAINVARKLDTYFDSEGSPSLNPWRGTLAAKELSPTLLPTVEKAIIQLQNLQKLVIPLLTELGLDPSVSESEIEKTLKTLKIIDSLETDDGALLKELNLRSRAWHERGDSIKEAIGAHLAVAELAHELGGRVNLAALKKAKLESLANSVANYSKKGILGRLLDDDYSRVVKQLREVVPTPDEPRDILRMIHHLTTLRTMQDEAAKYDEIVQNIFPNSEIANGSSDLTSWRRRSQLASALIHFTEFTSQSSESKFLATLLRDPVQVYERSVKLGEVCALYEEFKTIRQSIFDELQLAEHEIKSSFLDAPFGAQERRFAGMCSGSESWKAWQRFALLQKEASLLGLGTITNYAMSSKLPPRDIASGLQYGWHLGLAKEAIEANPSLAQFDRTEQEALIERFTASEKAIRERNSFRAVRAHWQELPRYEVGGNSKHFHALVGDSKGRKESGDLLSDVGTLVQCTRPIFVGTPKQVDENLRSSQVNFDLVIVDEGAKITQESPLRERGRVQESVVLSMTAPLSHSLDRGESFVQQEKSIEADVRANAMVTPAEDPFCMHLKRILQKEFHGTVTVDASVGGLNLDLLLNRGEGEKKIGILVDGYVYQGMDDALARERNRGELIEKEGILIHREWIVDWFRDPEGARKRFVRKVVELVNSEPRSLNLKSETENLIIREYPHPRHSTLVAPYRKSSCDLSKLGGMFRSKGKLPPLEVANALVEIARTEGPIHRDELTARLVEQGGFRKLTDELHISLVEGELYAIKNRSLLVRGDFLYFPHSQNAIFPRSRENLKGSLGRFERIAPEEVKAAVYLVVKHSHGIQEGEIVEQVSRLFGYATIPFGAEVVTKHELDNLGKGGVVIERNGRLHAVPKTEMQ